MKFKKHSTKKPELISDFRTTAKISGKKNNRFHIKNAPKKYYIGLIIAILLIIGASLWYRANHKSKTSVDLNTIMSKVGALIILPDNETPSLATVTDKKTLKDKFLSEHAENGDRILIYSENKMLIIYRPSANKIAAVGTISVDPALSESKNTSITIYDGSNNPEKVQKIASEIKSAYPDLQVITGSNTNRRDFPTTIVIDNTDEKDYLVDSLTKIVGAKRGVLPLGEAKATTNLAIIVGKD